MQKKTKKTIIVIKKLKKEPLIYMIPEHYIHLVVVSL